VKYPRHEFRHHPLMSAELQEPLDDVLDRCYRAVTYSSTVGAEALMRGCYSTPDCPQSTAWNVKHRAQWAHDLSWRNFSLDEFASVPVVDHILSGFQEAWARCQNDNVERPRDKIDKAAITQRYYDAFGN